MYYWFEICVWFVMFCITIALYWISLEHEYLDSVIRESTMSVSRISKIEYYKILLFLHYIPLFLIPYRRMVFESKADKEYFRGTRLEFRKNYSQNQVISATSTNSLLVSLFSMWIHCRNAKYLAAVVIIFLMHVWLFSCTGDKP